ncbi:FAD-dependent urate hydroxylase 3 [Colletotrichum truncatum]|uniref:FAD-dependent urate hydroxylase 3 n=1 Tax=Colletotrichum truncatum TaxID=5467 RepID=A0ACC3YN49_COLTU|nr:FAD-dependent urate hydroxylase 3 [Colletotrichum truncatum]KAF6789580.1 FAD-dependent urate hydroxylase 3 [Colletotrichum truncatum]
MASTKNSRVIIAGGGVSGLTLAIMLERFGIDYILLEAHQDISPAVGASIGLIPNALRIFDQLGVYDAIEALPHNHIHEVCVRSAQGKPLKRVKLPFLQSSKRHGYTIRFFDRQWLLQILYDSLDHKERVLTDKRVSKIKLIEGGIEVISQDGSVFRGSLLMGADGVHSTVREQMYRIANEVQPGYVDSQENLSVACSYQCSFGIAKDVPGYVDGQLNPVPGKGVTMVAISGPESRVYWFVFVRLQETKYGDDIPRYSNEDEAEFIKKYGSLPITENVTFDQIYAKRVSSTLTPLHEGVHKTWFFQRILLMGDSAHKSNPIGSQGGSSVVEAAALFLNALQTEIARTRKGFDGLTEKSIANIFISFQKAQYDRANNVIARAHTAQALASFEQPLLSHLAFNIMLPLQNDEQIWAQISSIMSEAVRVERLSVPPRPKAIPFDDELPAKPLKGRLLRLTGSFLTIGASLTLFFLVVNIQFPFDIVFTWGGYGEPLDRKWLPTKFLNDNLLSVVSVCSHPIIDKKPGPEAHLMYLLAQMISPNLIYTIEAYRVGNKGTLLASPFLNFAIMGIVALAGAQQYWTIIHVLFGHNLPTGRSIPLEVAHSILPALALGFVLPACLVFLPVPDSRTRQDWNALWQFGTFMFIGLTDIFARTIRWWRRSESTSGSSGQTKNKHEDQLDVYFQRYQNRDSSWLQAAYICACTTQAISHVVTVLYASYHPKISVMDFFFGFPSPWADWTVQGRHIWIANVLKYDLVLYITGVIVQNFYSIWELRRMGYINTSEAIVAATLVVLGQFVLGTGATWAALWCWREHVFTRLSTL